LANKTWHAEDPLYRNGDVIGISYRIKELIGQGTFGQVYRAYFRNSGKDCALKTFHDRYLGNKTVRESFRREASTWVALERHPFIVPAYLVEEINGRLFIAMECVEPDQRNVAIGGVDRVSLSRYLTGNPLRVDKVLDWSIQFCQGMEHANSHGVRVHLDIKPQNILIGPDEKVKITDFGTALNVDGGVQKKPQKSSSLSKNNTENQHRVICGTPGYIAPEVYLKGRLAADVRSDIYSFGLVMWQMASGSWNPPFKAVHVFNAIKYAGQVYELQTEGPVPHIKTPLWDVIEHALRVEPSERYNNFAELRAALEELLRHHTGRTIETPANPTRDADFWNNKGISLECLGRTEEAIDCYNKAIDMDKKYVHAWTNKGAAIRSLGRHEQALDCFDKALAIDGGFAYAWHGRANVLTSLERYEEAIDNYRKALEVDKGFYVAWGGQAHVFSLLGRHEQATVCYDEVLKKDRMNIEALADKALSLEALGRHKEALFYLDKALELNSIDPSIWNNKGGILNRISEYENALVCYEEAIKIDNNFVMAWENMARTLFNLGRTTNAIKCCEEVLNREPHRASTVFLKAACEDVIGHRQNAIELYRQFTGIAAKNNPNLDFAYQRLNLLDSY
jgi:serine/threonine protein kinase